MYGCMCLPFGKMSATSLYFVSCCSWVGEVVLLHGPVASACADVQDLLAFDQWGLSMVLLSLGVCVYLGVFQWCLVEWVVDIGV